MTTANTNSEINELPSDHLATGIAFSMGVTVVQRGVGFLRTALFCRLLSGEALGQWSLAFSFVMLAAPLTMMGVSGSFGRYVEYYYRRGQLRTFFCYTALLISGVTACALPTLLFNRQWFSWMIFGEPTQTSLIVAVAFTLLSTITYNFLCEIFVAMRRPRVSCIMELTSSWTFAIASLSSLFLTDNGSLGIILSFALGNLAASSLAFYLLSSLWKEIPQSPEPLSHRQLWAKIAPFALGLWVVNIATNFFDLVDRYMIIHFSQMPADLAQSMVGQYFSSLSVPLLMVGVGTTLAHLTMPYLSKDWEAGRFAEVSNTQNLSFKLIGLVMCIASVGILVTGPFLFNTIYSGKYPEGFRVLPWTITFCLWSALIVTGFNFLFCAEKTYLSVIAQVTGLTGNIVLNAILLPRMGLPGAAIATAFGRGVSVILTLAFCRSLGFRMDWRVLCPLLLPLLLPLGVTPALLALTVLILSSFRPGYYFSRDEYRSLNEVVGRLIPFAKTNQRGTSDHALAG